MTTANPTPSSNQPNQPPRPGCVMVSLVVVSIVVICVVFHPLLFAIVIFSPIILAVVALVLKAKGKGHTDE